MFSKHYTKSFYERVRNGSRRSAEVIVPLVLEFLPVGSVVDIGCGDGTWLSVFRRLGVVDILGIDGEYVDRDLLQVPKECFQAADLTKPFGLRREFDLALSLEVAEHLSPACASSFVKSLTRLAPAVLFSAAIPFQGGNHHINERWPDEWAALFRDHNYVPIDFLRKRVWENDAVDWWYAQNILLFAHPSLLQSNMALNAEFERTNANQLCLVHPRRYLEIIMPARLAASGLREASWLFMVCLRNAVTKRIDSITGKERRAKAYRPGPKN